MQDLGHSQRAGELTKSRTIVALAPAATSEEFTKAQSSKDECF